MNFQYDGATFIVLVSVHERGAHMATRASGWLTDKTKSRVAFVIAFIYLVFPEPTDVWPILGWIDELLLSGTGFTMAYRFRRRSKWIEKEMRQRTVVHDDR